MGNSKKFTEQEYPSHPFLLPASQVYDQLGTNYETGLSKLKAQEAQRAYGLNKLEGEGGVQWYSVLLKQISNAMILVRIPPYLIGLGADPLHSRLVAISTKEGIVSLATVPIRTMLKG